MRQSRKRSKQIRLFDFKDMQVWITVTVWPTLKDMRIGNGMHPKARCYAFIQPWHLLKGGLHGEIHFAEKYADHELVGHEAVHMTALLFKQLEIDLLDPDDEEVCAILVGQMLAAMFGLVFPD